MRKALQMILLLESTTNDFTIENDFTVENDFTIENDFTVEKHYKWFLLLKELQMILL